MKTVTGSNRVADLTLEQGLCRLFKRGRHGARLNDPKITSPTGRASVIGMGFGQSRKICPTAGPGDQLSRLDPRRLNSRLAGAFIYADQDMADRTALRLYESIGTRIVCPSNLFFLQHQFRSQRLYGQCQIIYLSVGRKVVSVAVLLILGPYVIVRDRDLIPVVRQIEHHVAGISFLTQESQQIVRAGIGHKCRGDNAAFHLVESGLTALLFLETRDRQARSTHQVMISCAIKNPICAKCRNCLDLPVQFPIADPVTTRADVRTLQSLIDQLIDNLSFKSFTGKKLGIEITPHKLDQGPLLLCQRLPIQLLIDFDSFSSCNDDLGSTLEVRINSPQGKGDRDQDHNRPGNPTACSVSDPAQHEVYTIKVFV